MALGNTGLIVGEHTSALLIAPQSAFVITAQCTHGCAQAFYVAGSRWVWSVDEATIFRSLEAGEEGRACAREACKGCLRENGVTFDVKPLEGFVG